MPIEMKTITSTKKGTEGQKVEVRDYWFSSEMEPIGVAYGCFSPFTGKFGHARLLENAKANGIKKFLIVSPNKKQALDNGRNMFTLEQKVEIAFKGAKDLGYKVIDSFIASGAFIVSNMFEVAERFPENRIVVLCGPDRIDEYGKYCIPFDPSNEEFPSEDENVRGKFEILTLSDRGSKEVSGTKVRQAIRDNDKETFLDMTGYSESMWNLVKKFAKQNGVLAEALAATNRVGIKHLYNPGNSQELTAEEFIDLIELIGEDGGKLINGDNFSLTEKSDGTAFRMGLDEEKMFFIEQSYSGPIYDTAFIKDKYEKKFGKVNRLARGWMNLLTMLQNDKKLQTALNKLHEKIGAFKISGEAFINELGLKDDEGHIKFVGSNYDEDKIGKDATIIMFTVNDSEGKFISDSEKIIKTLIKTASTESIKLDNAETNSKIDLNVSTVLRKIKNGLAELETYCEDTYGKNISEILEGKSRTKVDLAMRKDVRSQIENFQGMLNEEIENKLKNYKGKWGPDYEGVVLKFKDGRMIKITSTKFKEFKAAHDDSVQNFIMGESFEQEAYRFLRR